MKSIKLNASMRERLCRKLAERATQERQRELRLVEKELMNHVAAFVREQFTDAEWDTLKRCPEKWFDLYNTVRFNFGGKQVTLYFLEENEEPIPLPAMFDNRFRPAPEHIVYQTWEKKEQLRDKLTNEKSRAKSEAGAVINSVTTTGKLIQVWPEVEALVNELFTSDAAEQYVGLPAVVTPELNKKFCLP